MLSDHIDAPNGKHSKGNMINLPSDSIPKLTTFIGLAIVALSLVEQNRNIERLEGANDAVHIASVEHAALEAQGLEAIRESTRRMREATEALHKGMDHYRSGRAVEALAQRAIAQSLDAQAAAEMRRSDAARDKAAAKSVEIARLLAVGALASKRSNLVHWSMVVGVILGTLIFAMGFYEWRKREARESATGPRRVSRKLGK